MAYIPGYGFLSNPYIVFNDANGKPLSNGTVETYIAGTTTAYNTLKDWNGTYNGAIITLDIYGGCTIIAPETQGLKLIVKTSTGSLYKTFPNVFIGGSNQGYLPGTTVIRVDGTDGEIISVGTPDPDDPDKLIFTISLDPAITEAIATNTSDIGDIQTHINNIDNSITTINDTLDTLQTDVDIVESDVAALKLSDHESFINIDDTNSPYLIPESVDEIIVSTATDDVVVTLPVTSLKRFYVKWLLGTHNLTVNVADSGMIDGVASFVFNDKFSVGTSVSFVCKESGDWIANGTITDGSSGSGEVAHIATGDSLGAKDIIQLQAGSSTQWSAHGAMCSTIGAITPVMSSEMGFIAAQVVTGNFIIAAYKVETNLAHTLICSTGVTAFPSLAGWINTPVLNHVKAIAANDRVYLVVMTDSNGNAMAGASCADFNIQPYVAGIKTNMGVLTEAPATLTFDSETTSRPFIYMVK